jgi:hypothetical protein
LAGGEEEDGEGEEEAHGGREIGDGRFEIGDLGKWDQRLVIIYHLW